MHHYPQGTDPPGASRQSACHCSIESKWLLCECVFTHLHALKMNIVSKQVCSYVFMRIKHALMFSPLNAYFYITVETVPHTQSSLAFEDQQFLVVFRRWGGSEKKKSIRPSSANGLDTLCRTADLVGSVMPCSFKNRRFAWRCAIKCCSNNFQGAVFNSVDSFPEGIENLISTKLHTRKLSVRVLQFCEESSYHDDEHGIGQSRLTNHVGLKTLLKTIEMAVYVPEIGETKQGASVLIVHQVFTDMHLIHQYDDIFLPIFNLSNICYAHQLLISFIRETDMCLRMVRVYTYGGRGV